MSIPLLGFQYANRYCLCDDTIVKRNSQRLGMKKPSQSRVRFGAHGRRTECLEPEDVRSVLGIAEDVTGGRVDGRRACACVAIGHLSRMDLESVEFGFSVRAQNFFVRRQCLYTRCMSETHLYSLWVAIVVRRQDKKKRRIRE